MSLTATLPPTVDMSLESTLSAPFRHPKKLIATWLVLMAGVVAATALSIPEYRSEAKLFIRLGRENATLDPMAAVGQGPFVVIPANREQELNSEIELLKSRLLAERLVDKLGASFFVGDPGADPVHSRVIQTQKHSAMRQPANVQSDSIADRLNPFEIVSDRERAIKKFQSRLEAEVVKKSNVIQVCYDATSPEKAQQVLELLIEDYLAERQRLNRPAGSHDFLTSQSELMREQLAIAEEKLRDSKSDASIAMLDEHRRLLEVQLASLIDRSLTVQSELKTAQAQVSKIKSLIDSVPESQLTATIEGNANAAFDLAEQQLFALKSKQKELAAILLDNHPQMVQVNEQVREMQAVVDRMNQHRTEVTTGVNPLRERLEASLSDAQVQEHALSAKIAEIQRQTTDARNVIQQVNQQGMQIARLERDVALRESSFRKYADNLEQTRLEEELEAQRFSNVAIAQPPSLQPRMVRPRKLLNYALGFVLATVASLSLVILLELRNPRLNRPSDLEQEWEGPVMVSIPRVSVDSGMMDTVGAAMTINHPR